MTSPFSELDILAWSEPRLGDGDFAPEDPLAIDHLQQQIGDLLWPGFTTRTSRGYYYVMVCYGLRLVDEMLQDHGLPQTDENRRAWFERWERLWALAICAYFDGNIPNTESMRGKNGVQRTWRARGTFIAMDYPLISRQLELGALGAYRTSLIEHGLLSRETLRPTLLGAELARQMWAKGEPGADFDAFVRACLDPKMTEVLESYGRTTLRSLGARSRLSVILERPTLQAYLDSLLLNDPCPPRERIVVPEMARCLEAAQKEEGTDLQGFLRGVISSRWGPTSAEVIRNAQVGIVFGNLASAIRACFDRTYRAVLEAGYQASLETASQACLPDSNVVGHMAGCLAAWRATPEAEDAVRAEAHGEAFAAAIRAMNPNRPEDFLSHLLDLHQKVQSARGKAGTWIKLDHDRVLLEVTSYRSWSLDGLKWVVNYKHTSMSSLLHDLGRGR